MTSASPAILALETDSAWVVIIAVSFVTLIAVWVLHRLIGRPGGLASGILLTLPLVVPVVAGFLYEHAALPEISILEPAGRALLDEPRSALHLLLVGDGQGKDFVLYALRGSAGPYVLVIGGFFTSFMLMRRLVGSMLLRRLVRQSTPPDPVEHCALIAAAARISECHGLKQIPEILLLPEGKLGAFTIGGRHAKVLVARDLVQTLDSSEIEALLAHELAHIRARDIPVVAFAGLLRDLVAWNPLAHIAYRRLAVNRELEADRRAAEITRNPLAVASGLVKMCELMRRPVFPARSPAVAFLRPRARIKRRVSALIALADGGEVSVSRPAATLYGAAALLAMLVGLHVGAEITRGEGSGFAVVIGSSGDATRWVDPVAQRNRAQALPNGKQESAAREHPDARTPYSQLLSVRKRQLELWRKHVMRVARRRGIPSAAVFRATSTDLEAVPLLSEPEGGIGIYRLRELR